MPKLPTHVITKLTEGFVDANDQLFIVINSRNLDQDTLTQLARNCDLMAKLTPDGYITFKERGLTKTPKDGNYVDLVEKTAEIIGADLNDPNCQGAICTCPTRCDCQDHENGLVSNECPIHNDQPTPSLDCPQHGHPLFD